MDSANIVQTPKKIGVSKYLNVPGAPKKIFPKEITSIPVINITNVSTPVLNFDEVEAPEEVPMED